MGKKNEKNMPRLGKQPPRYRFFLNPYQDARFSKCPQCENKTGQRKLPLFIHIDPKQPLLLNKTCRSCHSARAFQRRCRASGRRAARAKA